VGKGGDGVQSRVFGRPSPNFGARDVAFVAVAVAIFMLQSRHPHRYRRSQSHSHAHRHRCLSPVLCKEFCSASGTRGKTK